MYTYLNKELVLACIAWFVAQFGKIIVNIITGKANDWKRAAFVSGGMPSSHSATVSALATAMACDYGLTSPLFGLTFIVAFIVMYDAMNVRRETGEQGKVLNIILEEMQQLLEKRGNSQRVFKELVGHTPSQVYVGCGLGILVGLCALL